MSRKRGVKNASQTYRYRFYEYKGTLARGERRDELEGRKRRRYASLTTL